MKAISSARSEMLARYKSRLALGSEAIYRERPVKAPFRLLRERSALIDGVLRGLWDEMEIPGELTLAAVGGYGRGELWPHSDIDILLLLPKAPDEATAEKLERFIRLLWDIGLKVGQSVRTVEDCLGEASGDLTIRTSLVEARPLAGNRALFEEFESKFSARVDPQNFYTAKKLEQYERYLRYQESPYSLEPNCKESPGGLRDLQMILWIAKAAGFGHSWDEMVRHGLITPAEKESIEQGEIFLQRVRILLHLHSGHNEDRLLFDYQETLARELGFNAIGVKRASECMMREYYLTAKKVVQFNTILLQNLGTAIFPVREHEPVRIDEDFQNTYQLLDIVHENVFNANPRAIFRTFELMQEHSELKGLTSRTIRALWRAHALIDDEFRADSENRARFIGIFKRDRCVLIELRRMNDLDILGAYLPKFGAIVGQMQHDLFHAYTVDQHTMQVLRGLRRFSLPEFAHEYPFCSRLISEIDASWLIYVAALFHDIAKGRGGFHPKLGAADSREFCKTHGLSEEETERVAWLVENHLVMSGVAQKKDISDPDVISGFASIAGDAWRLSALLLLTVADIRGTGPKIWNGWKGRLLEDLFNETSRFLLSDRKPAPQGILRERRREAQRLLRYFAVEENAEDALWEELGTTYFLRNAPDEIAWHTRVLHYRTDSDTPIVKARTRPHDEGIRVLVYTKDQSDLFSRLVSFFNHAGYNIVDAKIETTRHGYALDSFLIFDVGGRDGDRNMISYIEHELFERLIRSSPPDAPISSRVSRQVRYFPIQPHISVQPDEKGLYCILSISAADRPGLLYAIAKVLAKHGADIHTAKIVTLGERIEDNVLVSGGGLDTSAGRIQMETELLAELAENAEARRAIPDIGGFIPPPLTGEK
ncbi:MAG: [protein-PII] uridylyltransferase [Candidatus Accumulibacter sp.]|jgi:[protein-PII] uridylyltransferase|nr:[protein-PII] uridylyltransferase [Accumulibacter sp.]